MRTFAILFLSAVLLAWASVGAAGQDGASPAFSTLTSPDETFQIRYPKLLLRCQNLDGENPDVWSPIADCAASIPVCDSSGHAGNVLACLAYPKKDLHGSELQAAAFAVSRLESFRTEAECLGRWGSPNTPPEHSERIHGVKFQSASIVETQTSYIAEHSAYRTFHKGACYELDVNISTALDSAFAVEDKPRKLTPQEREGIKAGLMQALESFRFLK